MRIENPRSRNLIAWIVMLSIGTFWGSTIPLAKVAVSTGYQPLGLIFWQLVIGVLFLGLFLIFRGWRPRLNREKLFFYLLLSIFGTLLPNSFSYLAAAQLPAGVMAIAIATVPMWGLVMALGIGLEKFSALRVFGVLIGFIAMVMIAAPQTSLPDPEKAVFVLVALIAPFCYGVETNLIALKTPKDTDAISTLFMASLVGLIIVAPLTIGSGQWIDLSVTWDAPIYALVASSVIHAVTYVGYIWLVGFGGPVFGVQVAYPVTLSGVLLSIMFLGEGYSAWIWAALVLVIFGLVLVQPKLHDNKPELEEEHVRDFRS
jgi:drug/metabolite transporter (DMT)-like permease